MDRRCKSKCAETKQLNDESDITEDVSTVQLTEKREEYLKNLLLPLESQLVVLQRILYWEIPWASASLIITVNLFFYFATTCRPIYLIGIISGLVISMDMWFKVFWPEIRVPKPSNHDSEDWTPLHPQAATVPELARTVAEFWTTLTMYANCLRKLRSERKVKFFLVNLTIFSSILLISSYVSGLMLLYMIAMFLLLTPPVSKYGLLQRLYERLEPHLMTIEYSLSIQRRRKRRRGSEEFVEGNRPPHIQVKDEKGNICETDDSDLELSSPCVDPEKSAALAKVITDSEDEGTDYAPSIDDSLMPPTPMTISSTSEVEDTLDIAPEHYGVESPSQNSESEDYDFLPDEDLARKET